MNVSDNVFPDLFGLVISRTSSLKGFIFISILYGMCCICYPKIDGMMNIVKLSDCIFFS